MADSIISSGEIVSNTSLSSGDTMTLSGGNAYDTSISSGGQLTVSSGGTVSNTLILSGGQLTLSNGGQGCWFWAFFWSRLDGFFWDECF